MAPGPEITTMGQKGQVVIPKSIRDQLGLGAQCKFVVYSSGDLILMKRITMTDLRKEMEEVFASMDRKDLGLTEEDIIEEIQAMRRERREKANDESQSRG